MLLYIEEVSVMSIRSERIREVIEKSEMSYQEIEKLTGIKRSSLQRYATGVTTKIPMDVFEKLSVAFNVSQNYL
jgi:transcriptional regulator with XRE-family HTH domain